MIEKKVPTVLVVEDQESFRLAVVDELKFFGYETAAATDGAEALKLVKSTNFDLILSDMRMPNRDGRWLLKELRKIHKVSPPFIFMTGFADLAIHDAFEMGADGFLGKPVDSEKLGAILSKVCRPPETRWSEQPKDAPSKHISKTVANSVTASNEVSIGRGGMFVAVDAPTLEVGDMVSFNISFEDGMMKKLEGIGNIVWKRNHVEGDLSIGCGISFDYIAPASLPSWLKHLANKEIVPFIPSGRLATTQSQDLGKPNLGALP